MLAGLKRHHVLLITITGASTLILAGCMRQGNQPFSARSIPVAPAPQQVSFLESIEKVKHSIAPVVCVQTHATGDWDLLTIEGTAFFVSSDGSFITPGHVLDGLIAPNRKTACSMSAIYIPEDGVWHTDRVNFRIHYALFFSRDCARDTTTDLAFCTVLPNSMRLPNGTTLSVTPVEFESTTPPDGTPAAFSGFPLTRTPITGIGFIAGYQAREDVGTFSVLLDRTNWPGASGSPIYLQNGRVIGVVLARGTGDRMGLTLGRPSRFVEQLLPPKAASEPKKQ
jgi:hypothetical protein